MNGAAKVLSVVLVILGAFFRLGPSLAESRMNRVTHRSIPVREGALAKRRGLFVADLHADTTLWNRTCSPGAAGVMWMCPVSSKEGWRCRPSPSCQWSLSIRSHPPGPDMGAGHGGEEDVIDLAHASAATIDEVLSRADRPVVVSHTGVRGTCDNQRNLSDDQPRAIARNRGVVGIGVWETAVCGDDARAIARSILHAIGVAGVEHVALGSDFDGAAEAPFDVTGMPQITQALLDEGLEHDALEAVMGATSGGSSRSFCPGRRPRRSESSRADA